MRHIEGGRGKQFINPLSPKNNENQCRWKELIDYKKKKELTCFYFMLYSLFLTLNRVKYLGLTIKRDHRKWFLALNRIAK